MTAESHSAPTTAFRSAGDDIRKVDVAVIGAGVMGATTALYLARGGLDTALIDRGGICREASGVNAGTLTMHMTRAALIPYAIKGWEMWRSTPDWLGAPVPVRATDGLCLAFTDAEADLLRERSRVRSQAGAPIRIIDPEEARRIEPGLSDRAVLAAYCPIDGFASAYLTGRAYRAALTRAGVTMMEYAPVHGIEPEDQTGYLIRLDGRHVRARRLVLASGVWLGEMLGWLGLDVRVRCLVNQLVVTERLPMALRSVITVASGLLSLKQFDNGTALIGGGWQGAGGPDRDSMQLIPENLVGNVRLAAYAVSALRRTRILRTWFGPEAETDDAMPMIGPIPEHPNAYIIGSVHSGYTSGPYMGWLLARRILGDEPEMPLFEIDRLLAASAGEQDGPSSATAPQSSADAGPAPTHPVQEGV